MILLNKPFEPPINEYMDHIKEINESHWYSNFGPKHEELTQKLKNYLNVDYLLLVANATLGIQVAVKTLDTSNIVTTPYSFIATASALSWQNANFGYSDINEKTLNLCPSKLEKVLAENPQIDCILATHVFGNACEVEKLESLAKKYSCKVIYDAAHTFGVSNESGSILNFGDASIISFHATKLFHCIEGGAIVFKKEEDYEKARQLINFGISRQGSIDYCGINAKLSEYHAAAGIVNLNHINKIIKRRINLFNIYIEELRSHVKLQLTNPHFSNNGAYMPIILKNNNQKSACASELNRHSIQCKEYFYPTNNQLIPAKSYNELINAKLISSRILCLPMHYYLSDSDVRFIANVVRETCQ